MLRFGGSLAATSPALRGRSDAVAAGSHPLRDSGSGGNLDVAGSRIGHIEVPPVVHIHRPDRVPNGQMLSGFFGRRIAGKKSKRGNGFDSRPTADYHSQFVVSDGHAQS